MLGDEKKLDPGDLFHTFNVNDLIPANHMLRKLDKVLDTSWVRKEVADRYSSRGRPSCDPEVIIRMILLGYLFNLSEVRLVDELRMHMGYRWFCRLQPSDPVPDRTTLVKLRNEKWKGDIWRKLLERTILQCLEAGLISGKHVSIDGTKIKANAAWGSLEPIEPVASLDYYLEKKYGWDESPAEESDEPGDPESPDDDFDPTPRGGVDFRGKSLKNEEVRSKTDPDARIYRKEDAEGACLAYIGNFCLDTRSRAVLGAEASLGRTSGEWTAGANLLDFVASLLGRMPRIVTADKGYGVRPFYAELERRGIIPHIPPVHSNTKVRIPKSRLLAMRVVPFDRAKPLIVKRIGSRGRNKAHDLKGTIAFRVSRLLRLRVEHKIGEAKECHGLRRARHRGLDKMDNQIKITAAVMNLKLLARYVGKGSTAGVARAVALLRTFDLGLASIYLILGDIVGPYLSICPKLSPETGLSPQGF